ncbi:MAG: hypothetical protein ABIS86_19195 [Streptosporangiaceae bacterium]
MIHELVVAQFDSAGGVTVAVELTQWQPIDGDAAQLQVLAYRQEDTTVPAGVHLDAEDAQALSRILAALPAESVLQFAAALSRASVLAS